MAANTRTSTRWVRVLPNLSKFLLLQDSQVLRLQFKRNIADLIQKQRSLVRQFESANSLGYGAGERTFLMPKQLAFEKAERNRSAVHLYKRMTLARAQIVNCASDHLLAGARLTLDQDRRVRRRNDSNALQAQPSTADYYQ